MEILLMAIGRTRTGFVQSGTAEYMKRLRHYVTFDFIELPDVKISKTTTEEQQRLREGEQFLNRLQPSDLVILLDEKGRQYSSLEFSAYMEKVMTTGRKRVVFLIGGPYGFSPAVYNRADAMLSLSKMTFNHEMVRMFFIEQLYRAMTILRNEPYHHE